MKKNITILRKCFFALAITVAGATFCAAQPASYAKNLNAPISGKTKVTAIHLVRKLFPDAQTDQADLTGETDETTASANIENPIRALPRITPAENIKKDSMDGELRVRIEGLQEVRQENEKLLWLMINAVSKKYKTYSYAGHQILAVFRVGRSDAELIDAAIVKQDDYAWFTASLSITNGAKLLIAPRREAVFLATRATTNGGSSAYSLVELRDNNSK